MRITTTWFGLLDNPAWAQVDADGDGYATPEDCDDNDASIHPGAEDIPGDGIDQDCDGADATEDTGDSGTDADGDGYLTPEDCDDTDASIHPGAEDIPDDGIDQNCDGVDGVAEPVDTGDTSADTGDTGDTADTADTGDTGYTGETHSASELAGETGGCGCAVAPVQQSMMLVLALSFALMVRAR
ncbi:MAG: putative metal-binding motif-containing protein [Myxococcota bacterium]|nr:putative metal-binding motif-containing protein [Myxococcota bacterium]